MKEVDQKYLGSRGLIESYKVDSTKVLDDKDIRGDLGGTRRRARGRDGVRGRLGQSRRTPRRLSTRWRRTVRHALGLQGE